MPLTSAPSPRPKRPPTRHGFPFGGGALLGFVLGYGLAYLKLIPAVRYLPELGTWTFNPPPEAISMGWYGVVLWAVIGGGIGFLIDRLAPASRQRMLIWLGLSVALVLIGYVVWHESTRWGILGG
ncbi:MAG: hypothetical protein AAF730_04795 [Bacteroidota bacterium]